MLALEGEVAGRDAAKLRSNIFVALEMIRSKVVIGLHAPLGDKIAPHTISCGDVDVVLASIERSRGKMAAAERDPTGVNVCYEAGQEGVGLNCRLATHGHQVVVIDSASLLVNRRPKRAKIDRIDGHTLVQALLAYARGEDRVLSEVCVPTVEHDDTRRVPCERQRLVHRRCRQAKPHSARLAG